MIVIKIAIIGAGNIAKTAHIPSYRKEGNLEIVGISDVNYEVAKKTAEEFEIPSAFSDAGKMISSLKPDVVSICVPNKFHYPLTMLALENGCNVFCEKPPAITLREACEMEKKAQEKGKVLYYGFQNRFTSEYEKAEEFRKQLGRITHSKAVWLRRRGIPGWGVFTNKDIQGGGPLMDIGVHIIDMTLSLLGYPEISYVSATMSDDIGKRGGDGDFGPWDGGKYTVEDSLFGFIVFKDGTSLCLETSFAINQKDKNEKNIILYGTDASLSLFPFELYRNGNTEQIEIEKKDERASLMSNFIKSVRGNEKPRITAREATCVQAVIEALYLSAETNSPIRM